MKKSKVIKDGELATFDDFKEKEKMYIVSTILIKDPVVVQTTNKHIKNSIEKLKKKDKTELINMSNKVYRDILAVDVDSIYNKKQEWQNFCDDIILVYVTRNILYNSPIPVMPYKEFKKHQIEQKNYI
jgi:hypothetical protein